MLQVVSIFLQVSGLVVMTMGASRLGSSNCEQDLTKRDQQKNIAYVLIAVGALMSFAALTALVV